MLDEQYISCFATRLINSIIQETEYLVCLSFDTQIILNLFFFGLKMQSFCHIYATLLHRVAKYVIHWWFFWFNKWGYITALTALCP